MFDFLNNVEQGMLNYEQGSKKNEIEMETSSFIIPCWVFLIQVFK
tara:strand:+ start:10306 stop:10440 length:135 start_codon:yes stop_codon:yes gene_type:complete